MDPPEDALQPMDRLGHNRVDGLVVVDVEVLQHLHLQAVDVHVQGQQVKGEVLHLNEVRQPVELDELLTDDGPLGPEAGVVLLIALLPVQLNELPECFEILYRRFEEDHDLVVIVGEY